ncbi:MAG: tyrosine-type recombinase/integrase [Candidatus Dormibacteraceae bacterium]
MTNLAPTLQAFFTERLAQQRNASPHTIVAYRRTFHLLLRFVEQNTGKAPSRLDFMDLRASTVLDFLRHLETERANSIGSRNARLAAVHSFFHFASARHPEHAADIQRVLAIPHKRSRRTDITHLEHREIVGILAAPNRSTWHGRRDHAFLLLALQTGLRLTELTALRLEDLHLGAGAFVHCLGKGRKDRSTPLNAHTVSVLKLWTRERGGAASDILFPTRIGTRLSSDAVARLVAEHARTAADVCPTLRSKNVTPHVLRHTNAMQLLQAGVDAATIALWLGHERVQTTDVYLHADMSMKEKALARLRPLASSRARYQASDPLLRFLAGP